MAASTYDQSCDIMAGRHTSNGDLHRVMITNILGLEGEEKSAFTFTLLLRLGRQHMAASHTAMLVSSVTEHLLHEACYN